MQSRRTLLVMISCHGMGTTLCGLPGPPRLDWLIVVACGAMGGWSL